MRILESRSNTATQTSPFRADLVAQRSRRRVLSIERKKSPAEEGLEATLSSALRASDAEFGQILHEVDEMSKLLRTDRADEMTIRVAVLPAVWCAVKQALLDRELRHLAVTDDLTCLYNRRGFFAAATQQLKLAQRNAQRLLLLFCDVDNLKKINDTYGHREGDLALVRAADALEKTFRGSDIIARLSGDEFVVLAQVASDHTQDVLLRRLQKNLKQANSGGARYELSLCVGVAQFDPKHAVALGELLAQADKAMYEKKRKA
jgi:diguanylate cyclase (GGDEF)-like protein